MPEYIERDTVLKELNKNSITKKITLANGVSIFDTIKNIPTADVVEVVRCKNCEHFKAYSDPLKGFYGECMVRESDIGEDDYCSYGIRKEGAEE